MLTNAEVHEYCFEWKPEVQQSFWLAEGVDLNSH